MREDVTSDRLSNVKQSWGPAVCDNKFNIPFGPVWSFSVHFKPGHYQLIFKNVINLFKLILNWAEKQKHLVENE